MIWTRLFHGALVHHTMPTEVRSPFWKFHVAVLCLHMLLSLLCVPRLAAQAPPFSQAFVAGSGTIRVIALDSDGNIVVGGSPFPFSLFSSFLRHYTPVGNLAREAKAPNYVSRLVLDPYGRAYVVGRSDLIIDGGSIGVLFRYTPEGDFDWGITTHSTTYNGFLGVTVNAAAEVNVVGNSSRNFSFQERTLEGYSAYGFLTRVVGFANVTGVWRLGGYSNAAPSDAKTECLEIAPNGLGGFVLCGALGGSVVLGDIPVTRSGNGEQLFVAELDQSVTPKWVKLLPLVYTNLLRAYLSPSDVPVEAKALPKVRVDAQQNIYVSATGDSSKAGFLAKLDSVGTALWIKNIPALVSGMVVDGLGNVYCAGSFSSSLSLGATNLTSAGGTDIFVLKFRNDGQLIWAKRAGGANDDQCTDLTLDADYNPVLAGYFVTATRLDSFSLSSGNTAVASFVARLAAESVPLYPVIQTQPVSQSFGPGNAATFVVLATGAAPLTYQWRFNQTNIPGATLPTYTRQAVEPSHAGDYSVLIMNNFGSVTSAVAHLTVFEPPRIISVTGNTRPIAGSAATLVVEAAGIEPLTYEWSFNGDRIPGEFQSKLTLPGIASTQAGPYRAIVTNPYGSVTSAPVQLVVTYTLSVTADPGGTVSKTPDLESYSPGNSVDLLAIPDVGAFFVGWAGNATGTANPLRVSMITNRFITARFASVSLQLLTSGSGRIAIDPSRARYSLGDQLTLTAIPARWHRFVRWDDGVLNAARQITVAVTNRYTAFFSPTQTLETVTVGDVSRVAPVGMPSMRVDGEFITNSHVSRLDRARVEFGTTLPRATVLYTLDGRRPDFLSTLYQGPFLLTSNAVVRAVAFDESLTLGQESDPLEVEIIPAHSVLLRSAGGGDAGMTPAGTAGSLGRAVPRGTTVTVTGTPWEGWHFLQWLGDLGGTNSPASVLMDESKDILATFGTTVIAVGVGDGVTMLSPSGGDYEYGTVLRVNAIPAPENYFAFWAGGLGDVVNPLSLVVTNASLRAVAVFQPLPPGEVSLSLASDGPGLASVRPTGNRFKLGQRVVLKAVPDPEATFVGWSLESLGTENPVSLTLDKSYALKARFRRVPTLRLGGGAFPDRNGTLSMELIGEPGSTCVIEVAPELVGPWNSWAEQSIPWGRTQLSVIVKSEPGMRYFRVR